MSEKPDKMITCNLCGRLAPDYWIGIEPNGCFYCCQGHNYIEGCIIVYVDFLHLEIGQTPLAEQIRIVNHAIATNSYVRIRPDLWYFKHLNPPIEFAAVCEYGTFYPWAHFYDYGPC